MLIGEGTDQQERAPVQDALPSTEWSFTHFPEAKAA